jgi:hypothetical protein
VIHEVDDALRRLIREQALAGTKIEVALEAPTREWASRRNAPTVNVYLYDIREDLRRRESSTLIDVYDDAGRVIRRRRPPRYVKLSYLVTAWTQRPEDEHRLLSALLLGILRYEALPSGLLSGSLAALGLPVPVTCALPPPEDRAFADVWTALGGELKPSLDVVVSTPFDPTGPITVGPLVTEGMQLDVVTDERVGHKVRPAETEPAPAGRGGAQAPAPVAGPTPGKPPRITIVRNRTPRR